MPERTPDLAAPARPLVGLLLAPSVELMGRVLGRTAFVACTPLHRPRLAWLRQHPSPRR